MYCCWGVLFLFLLFLMLVIFLGIFSAPACAKLICAVYYNILLLVAVLSPTHLESDCLMLRYFLQMSTVHTSSRWPTERGIPVYSTYPPGLSVRLLWEHSRSESKISNQARDHSTTSCMFLSPCDTKWRTIRRCRRIRGADLISGL